MTMILLTVHVIVAVTLVAVVLVQRGEGADMGVSFGGGGAQTLFGSRGSGSFLGKVTGGLAAVFMLTSLTLAFFSQRHTGSIVEQGLSQQPKQEQPTLPTSDDGGNAGTFDASKLKADGAKPAPKQPAGAPLPGAK